MECRPSQVAQALLVDETTVRNWFQKYQQGGETELLALHDQGKESSLSTEQQGELAKPLDETIYLDSNATRRQGIMNDKLLYRNSSFMIISLIFRLAFRHEIPAFGWIRRGIEKELL